jgi:DNA invertase Pin-like site-specific DNA recombinase
MKAAIYTRISRDPDHDSWSPERQEIVCRQLAEVRGFEVVEVFTDRDTSAWNPRVRRPGWEALKQAVRLGSVEVVMAYSLTRLGRRVRELLDLSDFLKTHECGLVVADMNLDTTTSGGQLIYTMIAALAQLESEQISERVRSSLRVRAEQGRMHTGGRRQYGYGQSTGDRVADALVKDRVNEVEARQVRAMVDALLAGESMRQIATDMNKRGLFTTAGNQWTGRNVGQVLTSPRIAGMRTHNGQVRPGEWSPIVDEETWLRVRSMIDAKPGRGGGINTRRHLLSGIVRCGLCGTNMVTHFSKNQAHRNAMDRYTCPKHPGRPGCGRVAASKGSVDKYVTERFFAFMSAVQLPPAERGERTLAQLRADLVDLEAKMNDLARARFVAGTITDEQFTAVNLEHTVELDSLRRSLTLAEEEVAARKTVLRPGNRGDIEAWWDRASLPDKRAALQQAISHVVISPARVRGGNRFDTSRVHINWRWDVYVGASDAAWDRMTDSERERAEAEAQEEIEAVLELERAGSST